MIAGIDNKGTFAGSRTGIRAEASTMIVRLIDETYRININAAPEQPVYVPEIKEVSYITIKVKNHFYYHTKNRMRCSP